MKSNVRLSAAVLLALEVICVLVATFTLQAAFQFPAILREPASAAFGLFQKNQSVIVPAYYVFMLSGLLYLPVSFALRNALKATAAVEESHLNTMVVLGATTAIFQAVGFSRWIFLMPYLTTMYFGGDASIRQTVTLIYETFNRYAGMTIGEHLGFIAMGFWTIVLAASVKRLVPAWVSTSGISIGVLLVLSIGEHFGGSTADVFATLNFVANTLWTIWISVFAFFTLRKALLISVSATLAVN